MAISTGLCSLLSIKYPIFQGGMAWVATGELAAAVSRAGGLGIIGAGNAPADIIRKEIRKARNKTDKPFAVNIMLLSPFVDEIINLVIEENVPIITTGAGNPSKYLDRLKKADIKIIPVVPSVAFALRMEKIGVDALIVEGHEAGGHIGKLTSMVIIPQVVDKVAIPVIAAGGIADGRGYVAALSLGAKGIQLGTRFVCSQECTASSKYKKAIINAGDRDTVITGNSTGHPVRNLKNRLTREILRMEQNGAKKEEIEKFATGSLRKAVLDGDVVRGSVMAGQISGMVDRVKPVKEIIDDINEEAESAIKLLEENNYG